MKQFKFLLSSLILILIAVVQSSCSSDNDNSSTDERNPIERSYFTIDDASYRSEILPSGSEELLKAFSTTKNAINGGDVIVTINSDKKLSKAYISIDKTNGYYEVELKQTRANTNSYEYDILLHVIQNIEVKSFQISMSAEDTDNNISTVKTSETINIIEAGTGELQISLAWDQLDDVDLHVLTPTGEILAYYNRFLVDSKANADSIQFEYYKYLLKRKTGKDVDFKWENGANWDELWDELEDSNITNEDLLIWIKDFTSQSKDIYGLLDIDSNAGCDIDAINNENIYFTQLVKGTYTVAVNLFEKCNVDTKGAKYSVSAFLNGKTLKISDKQIGQFPDDLEDNYDDESINNLQVIGSFTVEEGIELPKVTETRAIPNANFEKRMMAKKNRY